MVELSSIVILGILAQWLAWRIKIPAILPLILIGLIVGPLSSLVTEDGHKLLEPMYNEKYNQGIFRGEYLFYFVSLAIGIILFEGGLTLKRKEISGVGPVILRLITIASTINFIGGGFAAHFIMQLSWPISFLFSGLIIVTGPTVIAPILQNIPLKRNVSTVLKWEGILIDPIGALVAVLVFEFIQSADGGVEFTSHALIQFFQIILIGLALGALAAWTLSILIKRELVPHYLLNVFTLAFVLGVFVFSNIIATESGLLAVVVMGTVLGNMNMPQLKQILSFKESLSVLLISMLFILLAANIDIADMKLISKNWRSFALFGVVAFVLRPIAVFMSTRNTELKLEEKIFISWVGPRGIVAAGIASLFGITLTKSGVEGAEYITPLVFMIVLGTVLINATTARFAAIWLGIFQKESNGILLIGASAASRVVGRYLKDNGRHVILIDSNASNIDKANQAGLEAFEINIYTDDLAEKLELLDMGYLLAMTSNADVNKFAVRRYQKIFGENGTFRLITPEELKESKPSLPKQGLLSYTDDYLNLNEVARDYPYLHELPIQNIDLLDQFIEIMNVRNCKIPLFIKMPDGTIEPIPIDRENLEIGEESFHLVYLGQKADDSIFDTVEPKTESQSVD